MKRGHAFSIKTLLLISSLMVTNFCYAVEINKDKTQVTELVNQADAPKKVPQPALQNHTSVGASNYLQMLLGLFVIVLFIFGVAWLIKKMGTFNPAHSNNLKVVAGLSVGQREKIIVLQVMGEQLLIGVTQSNIQLLSKLEEPLPAQGMHSVGNFQEKLQSAIRGFKKNSAAGDGK